MRRPIRGIPRGPLQGSFKRGGHGRNSLRISRDHAEHAVKTRAENSELLLRNFTIPGKSVAMPADSDRPLQAAIVHPADDLKVRSRSRGDTARRS